MTTIILGGGMTGLAAGIASNCPVFEAAATPGGICSSYYVRPHTSERLSQMPEDGEAYRFEIGGGHWIFGGDPTILRYIKSLTPVKNYYRRSSVYFQEEDLYIPYPLQNNLHYLNPDICLQALQEITQPQPVTGNTMKAWLTKNFGQTLCDRFFYAFHQLYTAGLYTKIAPQDAYKSPINLSQVITGALSTATAVGYNVTFIYPASGLNTLAQKMASQSDVKYNKKVVEIDVAQKKITTADGSCTVYENLITTLPLNKMIAMTGLSVEEETPPYTSVLVLNIGAEKGDRTPDAHWLYNPDTQSGFHRVGFYSNVDPSFLPQSAREKGDRVSIYVEKAYLGGVKPTTTEIHSYSQDVITELQRWNYIKQTEVVSPTWIDVAYTWTLPNSTWREKAMKTLEEHDIYPIGRYARWIFQGIADSIKDGFFVGSSFKQ
ncbi:MAG: FAD-dependent oxidoreductase [Gomphosphaeria aponina SAG 52.96 = DSM 107014]|uniref:FAD-dependent oxidoreductase n=1 Tax=Gomphosphaeria aponina SAG 52.96 = DSM 107014 TaxID=1521640 RepID=A0A941GV40_9CHRO|nr:FAD-dependent oxidoreductase [Gomphosphaeria aponina SAG 52.96 = DSM 107014]